MPAQPTTIDHMKNPWTKKNPFMSMWLSGANSIANRARGQATAAARREAGAVASRGMGDVLDFWSKALGAGTAAKRTTRKKTTSAASTRRSR